MVQIIKLFTWYSHNLGPNSLSNHWSFWECDNYIVDAVDEGVDAAVAHGQDVAPHPHVVDASEAATFDFISVVLEILGQPGQEPCLSWVAASKINPTARTHGY